MRSVTEHKRHPSSPSGCLVCVQDEKLALATVAKQALDTARDQHKMTLHQPLRPQRPPEILVCVQDEKLALANAVKQALNTARDAAQDGTLPAPQASKAPRVPRSTADRVGSAREHGFTNCSG